MPSARARDSVRLPSTEEDATSPTASTATMITAAASTASTSAAADAKQPPPPPPQPAAEDKPRAMGTPHIQQMEAEAPSDGERQREAGSAAVLFTMSGTRFMALVGMAFLWTSAQIPVYFWGGIPPIVCADLGGVDRWVWFITGNLLASAAVCPFVGALSDLLGRRYVALLGCGLVVVGQLVCAFARNMNAFIGGMVVSGAGAGINELTALAGTAEIAPTSQRGAYIGLLILSVLPFCPAVLWAQLIAAHAGWRFVGVLTAVYAFAGLLVLAVFYHPPPRAAAGAAGAAGAGSGRGLRPWRRTVLPRIDVLGGVLSIGGTVLFVAGLLWGGYQYGWASAHVAAPLAVGAGLLAAFGVWERWLAPFPMVPRRLVGHHHAGAAGPPPRARTMWLALLITFVSGANFFSVLMLWPSQAYNMYGHDPVGVGLRGLPFALAVLVGCLAALAVLTRWRGGNRWLLFGASAVMTAGCGALAGARLDNLPAVYVVLTVAGLGVGGIVVPASLVAMVVCPEDLIATATALTLAVRVVGGAVGYSVYFNVFVRQLVPRLEHALVRTLLDGLAAAAAPPGSTASNATAATNVTALIGQVIRLTALSQTEAIAGLPGIGGPDSPLYLALVAAGQQAYAGAYPYVYYCSIGFGVVSMVASLFMDDIGVYMDDHVSVVIA